MQDDTKEMISKLKMVTDTIGFSHLINKRKENPNISDLKMKRGRGVVYGIVNVPGYSIAEIHVEANSSVSWHTLDEFVVLVIYKGKVIITIGNRSVSLRERSTFYIEAGTPHFLDFPENTKLIKITIPETDNFPEGV